MAALEGLCRVKHRGAFAADAKTGDGAGVILPIPRRFLAHELESRFRLPAIEPARLGVAMLFVFDEAPPQDLFRVVASACGAEGIEVLAWRRVPTDPKSPTMRQNRPPTGPAGGPKAWPEPTAATSTSLRSASPRSRTRPWWRPISSPSSTRTFGTIQWRARSPSSTSAIRRTPSPPGNGPSRSASCATTARSTPSPGTCTGCDRAKGASASGRYWTRRSFGPLSTSRVRTRGCWTTWSSC